MFVDAIYRAYLCVKGPSLAVASCLMGLIVLACDGNVQHREPCDSKNPMVDTSLCNDQKELESSPLILEEENNDQPSGLVEASENSTVIEQSRPCTRDYRPVCAGLESDKGCTKEHCSNWLYKTYSNRCVAESAGAKVFCLPDLNE